MKDPHIRKYALLLIVVLWLIPNPASGIDNDRYFDSTELSSDTIKLAVCHPIILNIKKLIALKKMGFLPSQDLVIIGIFHSDEVTDYQEAITFAEAHDIDWMKFHKVTGGICTSNVYQKNNLTQEFEKIFRLSDGIIFMGGDDIPPRLYNEKTHLLTDIETPTRHLFELSFIFHLLGGSQNPELVPLLETHPDYPVFGICLGCQSLNVGTGGTLTQDIWYEVYGKQYIEDVLAMPKDSLHKNPHVKLHAEDVFSPFIMHRMKLLEDKMLCHTLGFKAADTPYVLSAHHQAVDELGKGMVVSATSTDGKVVEAIEHQKYPNVLGIQFHPEYHTLWDKDLKRRLGPGDKEQSYWQVLQENPPSFKFHEKLWSWFVEKLKETRSKRHERLP